MKSEPKPSAFTLPVRVYYEDTDAGGVVYHTNYLKYFERCRTEWMRSAGYGQGQLASEGGIAFVARKASCEYLRPARIDDLLTIGLAVEKITRVRMVFSQTVRRGDELLVTGSVEIACVNNLTMAPTAIPDFLYSKLEAFQ